MPKARSSRDKGKCAVIKSNSAKCNKTLTANGQCPEHGPWR